MGKLNWINLNLLLWIFTVIVIDQVQSSGLFEVRLKNFENINGTDYTGVCCSGTVDKFTNKCTGTCRTKFRICLKQYQAQIDTTSSCTYGDVVTPVLGENSMNLTVQSEQHRSLNPIQIPFNFTWPGAFTLILEAWHETNKSSHGVLILRRGLQRVLFVSPEWEPDTYSSTHSTMEFDYRVTCIANHYGSGCGNFCRPRDDTFGHYECSESGKRVCLSGWTGEYCTHPRCTPGCSEDHGKCSLPNECKCQLGWKGPLCDECEPHPNCVNGTCSKPWECNCKEGWGGQFCSQDLNYCTNHRPCKNGGTCFNSGAGSFTCKCPPGYAGNSCELKISDCAKDPCLNGGTCFENKRNQTYSCRCPKGWIGNNCEAKTLTCDDHPCNRGSCRDTDNGFKCHCPIGYSGQHCEVQVDECNPSPCKNGGNCTRRGYGFECKCPSGFTGARCEINMDDCKGNQCMNGGTCIDMVNQFRCQCIPGYAGSLCEVQVNWCLTKPCLHGGTCINEMIDFKCICPPGFEGKDCNIDIDECSSNPCRHGGTCEDLANDYQCNCPSGRRGKNCEDESYFEGGPMQHHAAQSGRSDDLSQAQVAMIAILSVAMPVIAIIAILTVICMKKRKQQAKEKDDAEARKQNEQNATASIHRGTSMLSYADSNPTIIKNTWDKSINNISNSTSVNDCLMNSSIYGGLSNYSDNTSNDYLATGPPLQRASSQKQLNTDPPLMHRASQIITSKDYLIDSVRLGTGCSGSSGGGGSGGVSSLGDSQRWQSLTTRQYNVGPCNSPSHM